jgi:hypothetical protein
MEKPKGASHFNAYVKSKIIRIAHHLLELGLNEKSIHEQYLGTIFAK